jgi:hypothetical protein
MLSDYTLQDYATHAFYYNGTWDQYVKSYIAIPPEELQRCRDKNTLQNFFRTWLSAVEYDVISESEENRAQILSGLLSYLKPQQLDLLLQASSSPFSGSVLVRMLIARCSVRNLSSEVIQWLPDVVCVKRVEVPTY